MATTPLLGAQMRPAPRESLARNLKALMKRSGYSQEEVARRTRGQVKQKTISNMLDPESHSPKLESIDSVAAVFGLTSWHLILPDLPADLDRCKSLAQLVEHYMDSPPDGQDFIEQAA